MEKVFKFLEKIGTVIVDRRFLTSMATLLFVTFGVKEDETLAVLEAVGAIVTNVLLITSWTVRAPSGLRFKEIEEQALIKAINAKYGTEL